MLTCESRILQCWYPDLYYLSFYIQILNFYICIECLTPFTSAFNGYDLSIKTSHTRSDILQDNVKNLVMNVSDYIIITTFNLLSFRKMSFLNSFRKQTVACAGIYFFDKSATCIMNKSLFRLECKPKFVPKRRVVIFSAKSVK